MWVVDVAFRPSHGASTNDGVLNTVQAIQVARRCLVLIGALQPLLCHMTCGIVVSVDGPA